MVTSAYSSKSSNSAWREMRLTRRWPSSTRAHATGSPVSIECEPRFFRSIALFDRENPAIHLCGDITVMPKGNGSITRSRANGENNDLAAPDERLRDCLAAQRITSYSGIALRNGNATVWGVLCHFDLRPRASVHSHSRVFAAVAGLLGEAIAGT